MEDIVAESLRGWRVRAGRIFTVVLAVVCLPAMHRQWRLNVWQVQP